jgi:serine/threonine protein kinase
MTYFLCSNNKFELHEKTGSMVAGMGGRRYRAPECLLTDGYYNYKMDMWGVGCVFFEIVSLFPLFPGTVLPLLSLPCPPPQCALANIQIPLLDNVLTVVSKCCRQQWAGPSTKNSQDFRHPTHAVARKDEEASFPAWCSISSVRFLLRPSLSACMKLLHTL